MYQRTLTLLITLLLLCTSVFATEGYYAGITISIPADGNATLISQTNYPPLESTTRPTFITQKDGVWSLAITTPEILDVYTYRIKFPANTVIERAHFSGEYSIITNPNEVIVSGFDKNAPLAITVAYTLHTTQTDEFVTLIPLILGILLFIVVCGVGYMFFVKKTQSKSHYPLDALTERQKALFSVIQKKKMVTQVELQRSMQLPKASLSRNIATLERKGLIRKERKGMTMLLMLKNN